VNRLLQDCRYAVRGLRKNLGLTMVVVLSLAIGIGANSAIFSVVDALLLRPLPFPKSERLANIWLRSPATGINRDWLSQWQYTRIRDENHSFDETAIARLIGWSLTGREKPERLLGMRCSSSLLGMLGARPYIGRLLLPEDDRPGTAPVAILSYGLWKRLFSGDPRVLGQSIVLENNTYTVVGVASPEFQLKTEVLPAVGLIDHMEIYLPFPFDTADRIHEWCNVVVRLRRGVSLEQAQADLDGIAARIRDEEKRDRTFGMSVVGLQDQVVGDVRRAVLVLWESVALVLLIACANVANLLMARAAGRTKEIAIRTALGAGGWRIARQLLTESLLLGAMGGAAGLAIARLSLSVMRAINPGNIPRLEEIGMNASVLAFTVGISLVTGVLFGLAPMWRAIRVDVNGSLKSGGGRGSTDGGLRLARHPLRGLLVAGELAFSLVLLVGAGLLIRSFVRLQKVPLGFNPDHVLSMTVVPSGPKYEDNSNAVAQFYQEIGERLRHLPGVESEGRVEALPLTGERAWDPIGVEGYVPRAGEEVLADESLASADYFHAMQIPLLRGRFFSEQDATDRGPVAIIDARFAQRFWPHEDPIGKHVWFDLEKPLAIVGVVGAVKYSGLADEGRITVYTCRDQDRMFLVVRTSVDPASLAGAIRNEIRAVEPETPIYNVRTMEARLHDSLARQRFSTVLLGAFAVFALLLAAVGVYGVMSYLVSQSTHDIGVRMALGAQAADIVGLVVRQGMTLGGIGIAGGLMGAAVVTRVMSNLLFGVSTHDAVTFAAVSVILAAVALAATLLPAARAMCVDPMVALREE
jgi:predicted permease